ncbi:MAG TPA: hypothetical protein VF342_08250 [Alphaproteobacteria bacterium]
MPGIRILLMRAGCGARRLMHLFRRASLGAPLAVALAAPAGAQSADRALDLELAREFMALETAGWRLPNPVEACLAGLALRRLEPMAFGSTELVDEPEFVDPPGPHYRILRVEPEPGDRRRRVAHIEWLLTGPAGASRTEPDSFVFVINDPGGERGIAAMVTEPAHLVVRRECFGT